MFHSSKFLQQRTRIIYRVVIKHSISQCFGPWFPPTDKFLALLTQKVVHLYLYKVLMDCHYNL